MNNGQRTPFLTADVVKTSPGKREIHIYNPETEEGFVVDGYAAVLCARLYGERTLDQVITGMITEFQLPEKEFTEDAYKFILELESLKVIRWLEQPIYR
jgi:hypothetical protein